LAPPAPTVQSRSIRGQSRGISPIASNESGTQRLKMRRTRTGDTHRMASG
jgi:hypothetical protein